MTAGEKAKSKYLKRQAYQAAYYRNRIDNETLEQKEKRLAYQRAYQNKYRGMRQLMSTKPNNLTYAEEMELEQKRRDEVNKRYSQKPKKPRKKRVSFPLAQKQEEKKIPKINRDNDKYRKVVKQTAKAYRALSSEEKLERIRIAYRNR